MKLCLLVAVLLQFCALNICQDMPDHDVDDMFSGQPSPGVRCTPTVNIADQEDNCDNERATVEKSEDSSYGGGMNRSASGGSGESGVLRPDQGTNECIIVRKLYL